MPGLPAQEGFCNACWGIRLCPSGGNGRNRSPARGKGNSASRVWEPGRSLGTIDPMHPLWRYYSMLWHPSTWRSVAYLLAGLPLGIIWFVYTVTMLATGVALVVVWVGIPLIVATLASMRAIGAGERALANRLIDANIKTPLPRRMGATGAHAASAPVRWSLAVVADGHAWRVALWTVMRSALGPFGFVTALLAVVMPLAFVLALAQALAGTFGGANWMFGAGNADVARTVSFWVLVGAPVLIVLAPLFAWAVRGVVAFHRPIARWALGPCITDEAAEATARAEVAEEQVRIDQELHDSIGHMITMNVIQAGAGAHVFDTNPEFARQALKNIEERGRAAMGELDRIIAEIRGDQPETRAPLPGIDNIADLIESSRAAGMEIEADLNPPRVPAALGRAAFAVVREALTNVAKHAPGAHVKVMVGEDSNALAIVVLNGPAARGARPAASGTGGRGIAGMRDRIELLGGRQHIATTRGGGYEVVAVLPLGPSLEIDGTWDSWARRLREKVAA